MLKPFGLWESPLSPQYLASETVSISDVGWTADGRLVWLEFRSGQGGLHIQAAGDDAPRDLNRTMPVRARVGYGGGDFGLGGHSVYFVHAEDGLLYRQSLDGGGAVPLTRIPSLSLTPMATAGLSR